MFKESKEKSLLERDLDKSPAMKDIKALFPGKSELYKVRDPIIDFYRNIGASTKAIANHGTGHFSFKSVSNGKTIKIEMAPTLEELLRKLWEYLIEKNLIYYISKDQIQEIINNKEYYGKGHDIEFFKGLYVQDFLSYKDLKPDADWLIENYKKIGIQLEYHPSNEKPKFIITCSFQIHQEHWAKGFLLKPYIKGLYTNGSMYPLRKDGKSYPYNVIITVTPKESKKIGLHEQIKSTDKAFIIKSVIDKTKMLYNSGKWSFSEGPDRTIFDDTFISAKVIEMLDAIDYTRKNIIDPVYTEKDIEHIKSVISSVNNLSYDKANRLMKNLAEYTNDLPNSQDLTKGSVMHDMGFADD
jgi:hypothetical protein